MIELKVELISDATFGRGDGVAGLVDTEVEFDTETGLPFIRGRVLKGLLTEECANILFALNGGSRQLKESALFLFGESGSLLSGEGQMHVGSALLPEELRHAVASDIKRNDLSPTEVLESLTAIRRQTSINEESGAPEKESLRSARVVLRETTFSATLDFATPPSADAMALLSACVLSLRRGGTGRNRGRGRLRAWLTDEAFTRARMAHFEKMITEAA
jgi:CRISPR/Cas system CMR subunit Cmr4 (Cas7 group RAMP superfamily)